MFLCWGGCCLHNVDRIILWKGLVGSLSCICIDIIPVVCLSLPTLVFFDYTRQYIVPTFVYVIVEICYVKHDKIANLNDLKSEWKRPRCLPDGKVVVRSSQGLYLSIIFSLVSLNLISGLEALNILNSLLLNGLVVSGGVSRLLMMLSATGVLAPNLIFSIMSRPTSGIFSAC